MIQSRSDHPATQAVRQRLARIAHGAAPAPASELTAVPTQPLEDAVPPTDPTALDVDPAGRGVTAGRLAEAFGMDGARFDPGRRGLLSLVVVAGAVLVLAAGITWWNKPAPEPVALPHPAVTTPAIRVSASPEGVVVAVAGKVRRPGLVTLPVDSRVADAVKAAGGVLPGTKLGYLNLARKVTDGELIVVGATPAPDAATGAGDAPGIPAEKLNLNTATLPQLDALPGVGPVLAQRILDFREGHGGFRAVADLRQVDGIGPARFEELKDLVTV